MKKFKEEVFYWLMSGTLGYMIYTNDYTYLNVVDAAYSIVLLISTVLVPFLFLVFHQGNGKNVDTARKTFKESFCGKSFLYMVWTYFKSGLSVVLLAISGHSFLLVWYIVVTVIVILFENWVRKQSW